MIPVRRNKIGASGGKKVTRTHIISTFIIVSAFSIGTQAKSNLTKTSARNKIKLKLNFFECGVWVCGHHGTLHSF